MFGMAFENLSAYLDSLREKGVPGCDLIVKQDHREIYRHTAGFRDAEGVQPVRMDDLYWLFSCTKVLTTCAAMQLIGQGNLHGGGPRPSGGAGHDRAASDEHAERPFL